MPNECAGFIFPGRTGSAGCVCQSAGCGPDRLYQQFVRGTGRAMRMAIFDQRILVCVCRAREYVLGAKQLQAGEGDGLIVPADWDAIGKMVREGYKRLGTEDRIEIVQHTQWNSSGLSGRSVRSYGTGAYGTSLVRISNWLSSYCPTHAKLGILRTFFIRKNLGQSDRV